MSTKLWDLTSLISSFICVITVCCTRPLSMSTLILVSGGVRPTPPPRQTPLGHNPPCLLPFVGLLGSGPRLVGRIGSVVRVSVSFQQKYPPGSVLRCPTAAENGVMTKGVVSGGVWPPFVSAYNVEPVTNTSSSSCANNERRTPRCARRSPPFVVTRTVDNTVDLTAAKPGICLESRFLPTPPAFNAPVRGGLRLNIAIPFGMEKLEWLGYPMVKKFWRYVYSFSRNSRNVTNRRTDTACRHRPRLCIASRGKNLQRNSRCYSVK